MSMASMALSKKEVKDRVKGCCIPSDSNGPKYPYGLEISLNEEGLKKLGLTAADLAVGQDVTISAKAVVVSVSSSERVGGKASERAELQITHLSLGMDGDFERGFESVSKKGDGE